MTKRLRGTPEGSSVLEIEAADGKLSQFILPPSMSVAARIALLTSPRLEPILARIEEDGSQGAVVFALHKLAMDLMVRHPAADAEASPPLEAPSVPVARIVLRHCQPSVFVFCASFGDESVCREEHVDTLEDALAAALLVLPPAAHAVEVTYDGVVCGTYPRPALDQDPQQVAASAVRTTQAVYEADRQGRVGEGDTRSSPPR